MTSPLDLDLTSDPAGRASAFALGCASTYMFVRNLVMRPAVKSCHQQIADLRVTVDWLKDQMARKDDSVLQLQAALLASGGNARNAMQAALSGQHQDTLNKINALAEKLNIIPE